MAHKNERNTENLVRDTLRELGSYNTPDIIVEEQKSQIETVKKLLKNASKSQKGGVGAPEFIVSAKSNPDFLLIIECKANVNDHISNYWKSQGDPQEQTSHDIQRFAVDGVLHYGKALSREYNVICVAISGETKPQAICSVYLYPKDDTSPKELKNQEGFNIDAILPWDEFIRHATFDPAVQHLRFEELMAFSRELHDFMRDYAKLTESEKPLLVSGTLIALRNKAFAKAFGEYKAEELQKAWIRVIGEEISAADMPKGKKENMVQPYSSIAVHPELGKPTKQYPKGILFELIKRLYEKVWAFFTIYQDFDIVGQFYGEFLKYTGGDKKALGIVLTPRHITELFSALANVHKSSKVLDICAGTGGFLISAMKQMMESTLTQEERETIKATGLIGVEQMPNMFALAASNMILRGDGKANLYQGSCFDEAIKSELLKHQCTVGMLNPPFSQGTDEFSELRFVKQMLDCLEKGSLGIAIVPMSCAIAPHSSKIELLKHHTLEAVMSMPDELFYPVGTVTCIMVLTAHVPHEVSKRKTWFGYWKNDGFVKTKNRGRIDQSKQWTALKSHWVETFRNREVIVGYSVLKTVDATDEWCAEAYMQTNYAIVTKEVFEKTVKNFLVAQLLSEDEVNNAQSE
jgi:type I restriction enzyme M protein